MNYERVFTWYIGEAIEDMIRDGVMYAELRPMLLDKSIPSDDGKRKLDHSWQMNTIINEVQKKKAELQSKLRQRHSGQARYSALNAGPRKEYVRSCRYYLSINLGSRVMGRKRDKVIKSRRANNQEVEQTECEISP